MYQKKIYQPSETDKHNLREFMKTDGFKVLEKWANWEYMEGCKYVSSLIPHLNIMTDDDKKTLEKENDIATAVSQFFDRVRSNDPEYIGELNQ